jgi:hypothetical protein
MEFVCSFLSRRFSLAQFPLLPGKPQLSRDYPLPLPFFAERVRVRNLLTIIYRKWGNFAGIFAHEK